MIEAFVGVFVALIALIVVIVVFVAVTDTLSFNWSAVVGSGRRPRRARNLSGLQLMGTGAWYRASLQSPFVEYLFWPLFFAVFVGLILLFSAVF